VRILIELAPDEPLFDRETGAEFVRSLIASLIWIPYMIRSKRIKAIFRSHTGTEPVA